MHYGIVGMSESGKSTLGKILAKQFRKQGVKVAVLDPLKYSDWDCDFQTSNPDEFLRFAKRSKSHVLIIDEGGQAIGRYNRPMEWLLTTSRHLGHSCIVITQGVTQLPPIIRGQFSKIFLFTCSFENWQLIAGEYNRPEILKMGRLEQGRFIVVTRFGDLAKGNVDFGKRKLYYESVASKASVSEVEV